MFVRVGASFVRPKDIMQNVAVTEAQYLQRYYIYTR